MWSSDRRRALALIVAAAATGACGFRPLYEQGGGAANLRGGFALPEATDPVSFAFRDRALRRLGQPRGDAPYRLEATVAIEEIGSAIAPNSDVTRFRLVGRAVYSVIDLSTGKPVEPPQSVETATSFDASAGVYATRSARIDAEQRLATELAELVSARLLATMGQASG